MVSIWACRKSRIRAARSRTFAYGAMLEGVLSDLGVDVCELRLKVRLSAVADPSGSVTLNDDEKEHKSRDTKKVEMFYIGDEDEVESEKREVLEKKLDCSGTMTRSVDKAIRIGDQDVLEKDLSVINYRAPVCETKEEAEHRRKDKTQEGAGGVYGKDTKEAKEAQHC